MASGYCIRQCNPKIQKEVQEILFPTPYLSPPLIYHSPVNAQTSHTDMCNLSFVKKAITISAIQGNMSVSNECFKRSVPLDFEKTSREVAA